MLAIRRLTWDEEFRFWSQVSRGKPGDCWEWSKTKAPSPSFKIGGVSFVSARIAYFLHHKIDPGEELVLHKCNNRKCMNPGHLYLDDHSQNLKDRYFDTGKHPQGNAKIDLTIAMCIRDQYRTGTWTQAELSGHHKLTQSVISDIINHVLWKEI